MLGKSSLSGDLTSAHARVREYVMKRLGLLGQGPVKSYMLLKPQHDVWVGDGSDMLL
jgi:hypothetical protein